MLIIYWSIVVEEGDIDLNGLYFSVFIFIFNEEDNNVHAGRKFDGRERTRP